MTLMIFGLNIGTGCHLISDIKFKVVFQKNKEMHIQIQGLD